MRTTTLLRSVLAAMMVMLCSAVGATDAPKVNTSALSTYDKNAPIGFGASITGSGDENPVTVTTLAELTNALTGTDAKTIYVSGTITFTGSVTIESAQDKTVYGLPGAELVNPTHTATVENTGILTLKNCNNIIIRNLTFKGAGAYDVDGNDNLTLSGSTNIWIDHCDFQDGVDGNLDCNNGSDNICVSWCRFRYLISPWSGGSGGSNDHRFSNLWGGGDTATGDEGKLKTTFYACWWDDGCKQRMPRVRFGKVHILNCLYSSSVADYCIGAGYKSNLYVENSVFNVSSDKVWQCYATESGYTDYNIKLVGNSGAADATQSSGSITQFEPTYNYTAIAASDVQAAVTAANGAGATLTYGEDELQSGTVFSANVIATSKQSFNTGTTQITAGQATIEGGKIYAISAQSDAKELISNQGSTYYFCMTNNNTYFKIELDHALAAGDVITADALGGVKNDLPKGLWITTTESYPSPAPACAGTSTEGSIVENILNYTVTEASEYVGAKTLYIYRSAGATEYFGNFKINRPSGGEAPDPKPDPEPDPEPATWRDFSAIVNNQSGTLLTTEEQVQGTALSFGIAVAEDGTVSRVAADDASSIATISGTYHSEHGMTGMTVVTAVPGAVKILVGQCTYSSSAITVTNSNGEVVATTTPAAACWKGDRSKVTELIYDGDATTLTITGMSYCPFIAVKEYVAPAEFRDFSAIVNNQTGTLLTTAEQVQGTNVNFGIAVAEDGTVSRVAADDASSIATISGKYHNDHGMTGLKLVTAVPGKVKILVGQCTYSSSDITVTNSEGEIVAKVTPETACWKDDNTRVTEIDYKGGATTLSITGMGYCPFIAVQKVKTAQEKSLYSTDFSDWSTFGAGTSVRSVTKKTQFSDEDLTFSVYNTALASVNDTKFSGYTTLPHNALQAAKAADPYVTTSALANITKVRYVHGATGSNRGWKLEAKGDGDTDWVTVSDSYANPAGWCEVTQNINKKNCQLRFTNLNSSQNAYMFELEIFGEVDLKLYDITGTITGGNIDGSTITLTDSNGDYYDATVADGQFAMSVPAGTYTPSLSSDVAYLLVSPSSIEVSEDGSIGAITIEAGQPQVVTGRITNAPTEAFTLTFTGEGGHSEVVDCAAGATSYSATLVADTYTISSDKGTLSPLSQESFKVILDPVQFDIYYPEAAVPAATQQNITVDNTAAVAANVYNTVTDALAAAKAGNISKPIITLTSNQTYREQVIVDQADVTLKTSGEDKATITFYYGIGYAYYSLGANGYYDKDRAMTRHSIKKIDPARWGCTVKVTNKGNNFKAENIVFENSFNQYYTDEEVEDGVRPNGVQAISYDRTLTSEQSGYKAADAKAVTERAAAIAIENNPTGVQFYNCTFIGSQDTYYTSGTIYVKDCNIVGNTDYIFGGGYVVFDNCDLTIGGYSDQHTTAYITAYKDGATLDANKKYVFRDCTVKSGGRKYVSANLGRDWGGAAASVYYFNLKNEIGNKLDYKWQNMGGAVSAGTADLHIYDFDPTVNANYSTTGSTGANINGVLSEADALTLYGDVVTSLGFTPERICTDVVELSESSAYNKCRIAASDEATRNVTLTRSITGGNWSTICLPFGMTADQVTATFGTDTKLATISGYNSDTKEVTTASATTIAANTPCFIKVADNVSEGTTIEGVTFASGEPEIVIDGDFKYVGVYSQTGMASGDFFLANNKLYKATENTNAIKPFRAYFTGVPANARILFTDGEATRIDATLMGGDTENGEVYDLQGRRVERPVKKGLYINGGRKVIIK